MTVTHITVESAAVMDRRTAQRSHILAIARRHFLARGYAATTMSAIAANVGGSKATLWNHFKSKDDLFAELVKTDTEGIHAEALVILDREGETFEILCTFAETYITAMSTPAALRLQRQAAAVIERIAIGRLLNDRLVGVVETRLANFFATRMAMGALRRSDPGRAAQLTIALCLGLDPRRLFRPAEAADRKSTRLNSSH